jgi:type IV secretory pathway VirB6-like protein
MVDARQEPSGTEPPISNESRFGILEALCYNNPKSQTRRSEENLMNTFFSIVGLLLLLVIVWVIARFVLKLAGRVIGCLLTAILAIGILIILWVFVF